MKNLRELKPEGIWKYFERILTIPRPSGSEEKIVEYLIAFAEKHDLEWKKDTAGNVLIKKPASTGMSGTQVVVLQSHLDMVCESNAAISIDFQNDPIKAYIDDGWVKARGTTLGADNGIGIAAELALLEDNSLEHGPLECLFTLDEERGLTGAFQLGKDLITGHTLLNLDSEDEGEVFIGCAGGIDTRISCPVSRNAAPESHKAFRLSITGLKGGHSGDDINKGRGNANKILARLLVNARSLFPVKIASLKGGNLRNAIPREAHAVLLAGPDNENELRQHVESMVSILKSEIGDIEKDICIAVSECEKPDTILEDRVVDKILSAIYACPNGVIEMSRALPGLVETSTNLASIRTRTDNTIVIVTNQRSSLNSAKIDIASRIGNLFELIGAKVEHTGNYPGWNPNPDSLILRIAEDQYTKLFGKKPRVRAIHAGLECGLFLEKYPELDMVSIGPTIRDAHSPDERMEIDSVDKFWKYLLAILKNVPEN